MIIPKAVNPILLASVRMDNLGKLPEIAAIYFILNDQGKVLYIEKTENIKHTWNSHDKKKIIRKHKGYKNNLLPGSFR